MSLQTLADMTISATEFARLAQGDLADALYCLRNAQQVVDAVHGHTACPVTLRQMDELSLTLQEAAEHINSARGETR